MRRSGSSSLLVSLVFINLLSLAGPASASVRLVLFADRSAAQMGTAVRANVENITTLFKSIFDNPALPELRGGLVVHEVMARQASKLHPDDLQSYFSANPLKAGDVPFFYFVGRGEPEVESDQGQLLSLSGGTLSLNLARFYFGEFARAITLHFFFADACSVGEMREKREPVAVAEYSEAGKRLRHKAYTDLFYDSRGALDLTSVGVGLHAVSLGNSGTIATNAFVETLSPLNIRKADRNADGRWTWTEVLTTAQERTTEIFKTVYPRGLDGAQAPKGNLPGQPKLRKQKDQPLGRRLVPLLGTDTFFAQFLPLPQEDGALKARVRVAFTSGWAGQTIRVSGALFSQEGIALRAPARSEYANTDGQLEMFCTIKLPKDPAEMQRFFGCEMRVPTSLIPERGVSKLSVRLGMSLSGILSHQLERFPFQVNLP